MNTKILYQLSTLLSWASKDDQQLYLGLLNNLEEPYDGDQEVNLSPKWEDVI